MTQYNNLNAKLSNSQLNKLKLAIKNEIEVISRLSSNMIGTSDDETNFPDKLLLINRQGANLLKAFTNNLSDNFKLSKTQLSEITQSGWFCDKLHGPLLKKTCHQWKTCLDHYLKLAISYFQVLISLGLTAVASETDAGLHKKS